MAPLRSNRAQRQKWWPPCSGQYRDKESIPANWCLRRREGEDEAASHWLWGRNGSLCTPGQTHVVLSPCSRQLCSAPQHFAAYVRAWQQELIVLSVLSAGGIAVCVSWVIWLACFWVGWGVMGKGEEQVMKRKGQVEGISCYLNICENEARFFRCLIRAK